MNVRLLIPLANHKVGDVVDLDRGSAKMLLSIGHAEDPDAQADEDLEEDDETLGFGPADDYEDQDRALAEDLAIVVTSDGVEHVGILPASAAVPPDADADADDVDPLALAETPDETLARALAEREDEAEPDAEEKARIAEVADAEREAEAETEQGDEPFDPADHTVDEVIAYLSGDGMTDEERARVIGSEEAGKARKSLVGQPPTA